EQAAQPVAIRLHPLLDEILNAALQGRETGVAAILNLHLESASAAQTFNGRRAEDGDLGLRELLKLLPQLCENGRGADIGLAGPFFKRRENDEHAAGVADVRA